MRSGSLVLFFAAAFSALKGADSESDTQVENNVISFSDAQNNSIPEQKDNKTRSGTGEELVLHQEHLHQGLAKKGPGFYVTGSGAAYFLMKYFEAIWRRENKTSQARRLAAENSVFKDEELEHALKAINKMKETLEKRADAALKHHLQHHDNRAAEKDPQLDSLRLAVTDALRLLEAILQLMARLEDAKEPTLAKLVEPKLDELAASIGKTKKLLMDMFIQKEMFARRHVENAQKELERANIATLNHKTHKAKELVASAKMRDAVIAEMETLVEEVLTQATKADQPQPTQPNYALARELAKAAKIFILEIEAYILMLRELNEGHRDALNRAALELDFARAGVAGLPQIIDIFEIIGNSIDF